MTAVAKSLNEPDLQRRFGGVDRLYGAGARERLAAAHVCIVGIGGVGSWVVEALARSAVGTLTLVDLDMIAESNVNRQIHALGDSFGLAKVSAMAERVRAINPTCRVHEIEDFVTADNVATLLAGSYDYLIDAIDQVRAKAALIAWWKARGGAMVTVGGAGGKSDPTRLVVGDLARTEQDPLLAKVRSSLRRDYGFPRGDGGKFGVPAVYSQEPIRRPAAGDSCAPIAGGLNCAGFGSSVCVTASVGFIAAAQAIDHLVATGRC
ncbi:tRNA threonylcarbamoyladenosine dehydratase [Rhodocyclus tenuis]|uniref:tRNA threonylcarbamoyladenosine dehydratase n=1 Tax=Rhodocyclus gracilis TaxID=2929842 RepID=A0ABX0WGS7_9RHOO|nr:tRNA threonylcarbamoyladenosine dehydratase [Rhodocyclus gracilis]NJA88915.1 tRNA threonylcarbamoyladenosine dehydratase [Rhodocyclus gracilis]